VIPKSYGNSKMVKERKERKCKKMLKKIINFIAVKLILMSSTIYLNILINIFIAYNN